MKKVAERGGRIGNSKTKMTSGGKGAEPKSAGDQGTRGTLVTEGRKEKQTGVVEKRWNN